MTNVRNKWQYLTFTFIILGFIDVFDGSSCRIIRGHNTFSRDIFGLCYLLNNVKAKLQVIMGLELITKNITSSQ